MALQIKDVVQEIAQHLSNHDVAQFAQCSKVLHKHVNTIITQNCKLSSQLGKMCLRPMQLQLSNTIFSSNARSINIETPFKFGKTLLSLHIALTHPGRWVILCRPEKFKRTYNEFCKCFPQDHKDVVFANACENFNAKVVITTNMHVARAFNKAENCNLISEKFCAITYDKKQITFLPRNLTSMLMSASNLIIHNKFVEEFLPETQLNYFSGHVQQIIDNNFHTVIFLHTNLSAAYRRLLENCTVFKHNYTYRSKQRFETCKNRAVLLVDFCSVKCKINADAAIIINPDITITNCLECVQCAKTANTPVKFYIKS